jgi:5'-3' exonuclease
VLPQSHVGWAGALGQAASTVVSMGTGPVLAIDGNNLIHRAHHAMAGSGLSGSDGEPLWALHGLVGLIAKHVAARNPGWLLVAFDAPDACVERRVLDPQYKAGRAETDPGLRAQLIAAPDLLRAAGICVVQAPGREADDVLASVASTAARAGIACELLTADRDALRCVGPTCVVISPDGPVLDQDAVWAKYGVPAERYAEFAALVGEPGDNLPGVPGVGPKNAARILARCDHLEKLLCDPAAAIEAAGARLGASLVEQADRVRLTLEVARLRDDVDVLDDLRASGLPLAYEPLMQVLTAAGLPQAAARLARAVCD